jgi:hypothetical protein
MNKSAEIYLPFLCLLFSFSSYSQSANAWKNYSIRTSIDTSYLNAKKLFHDKSKASLENNIADFYLYKNGILVKPTGKIRYDFFPAGCLCFKFDDTLMLNSGLGSSVGVGVGIKIVQGKFTSTLHANSHNPPIYKFAKDDSEYVASITTEPETQSLHLYRRPSFTPNEVIIGEYRATYKTFFQKNRHAKDEIRKYTVKIIFKCRVTGIDSLKSLTGISIR